MPPRPTPRSTGAEPSFSSGSRGRTHRPRRPPVIGPRPRGPVRSNPGMVVSPHFVLICVKIYKCIEWCCSALQPEVIRPVAVPPGLITSLWKDGRWKDVPGETMRQGGGRGSGRAAGVVDCSPGKTFSVTRRDRGGGSSIPLPGEPPPPRGRFPVDTAPRERSPLAGFRQELPEESCLRPTVPGENLPSSPVHPRPAASQPPGPQSFPIPRSSAGRSRPPVYPRISAHPWRRCNHLDRHRRAETFFFPLPAKR